MFRELLEARTAVERALSYQSARNITADQISVLEEIVAKMEDPEIPTDRFVELNLEFHGQIAAASANRVLQALQLTIRTMQGSTVGAFYSSEVRADVIADHAKVLGALRARDSELAADEMGAHLDNFLAFLSKHHPDVLELRLEPLMPTGVEFDPLSVRSET